MNEGALPDPKSCQNCRGTGFQIVELEDGRTHASACSCRGEDRAQLLLDKARIPRRYHRCDFENFNEITLTHRLAKQRAEKFARGFPSNEFGLLFMGPPGVGKTHLAVALMHHLMRNKGTYCLFYDFQDLLKEIQNSYDSASGTSELRVLQPIFAADVLVLDDVGTRKPSVWVAETLAHIISTRYNDVRTTIFTTNYLDKPAGRGEATLTDRIGERVRSRLYEMCQVIEISGTDFRREIRQANFRQ